MYVYVCTAQCMSSCSLGQLDNPSIIICGIMCTLALIKVKLWKYPIHVCTMNHLRFTESIQIIFIHNNGLLMLKPNTCSASTPIIPFLSFVE